MPIHPVLVEQCLLPGDRFAQVWRAGLDSVSPAERRGALCVETGTIAESVMTLLFQDAGLDVFFELATAGVHGVDLLALTPAGEVVALEVKGTLRSGARPRLGRGRLAQMSREWLSSTANPAMVEWELEGADVYGGVAHLDFARMQWRMIVTQDYESWFPIIDASALSHVRRIKGLAV